METDRQTGAMCNVVFCKEGRINHCITDPEFDKYRVSRTFNWSFVKPDGETDKRDRQTDWCNM